MQKNKTLLCCHFFFISAIKTHIYYGENAAKIQMTQKLSFQAIIHDWRTCASAEWMWYHCLHTLIDVIKKLRHKHRDNRNAEGTYTCEGTSVWRHVCKINFSPLFLFICRKGGAYFKKALSGWLCANNITMKPMAWVTGLIHHGKGICSHSDDSSLCTQHTNSKAAKISGLEPWCRSTPYWNLPKMQ